MASTMAMISEKYIHAYYTFTCPIILLNFIQSLHHYDMNCEHAFHFSYHLTAAKNEYEIEIIQCALSAFNSLSSFSFIFKSHFFLKLSFIQLSLSVSCEFSEAISTPKRYDNENELCACYWKIEASGFPIERQT